MIQRFLLLFFLLFFLQGVPVFSAPPKSTPTLIPTPTIAPPTPTPTPIPYELPYPGILPDNPLYPLKALRDRIISFLITDPLKKGEFYLLSSDKRLNTGIFLIQKKKDGLAVSTISKGINYFHQAVAKVQEAQGQGKDKDVAALLSRMKKSLAKHKEVILDMQGKVEKRYVKELEHEHERVRNIEELVDQIPSRN